MVESCISVEIQVNGFRSFLPILTFFNYYYFFFDMDLLACTIQRRPKQNLNKEVKM